MSTYMANKATIERKWYVVDAAGKPLGKATLSGNKMEQKYYRTHSGWIGGLKETKYRLLMQEKPELAMRVAVRGMMPRNTVTKDSLKRLHIYAGEQHIHEAQKPELVK